MVKMRGALSKPTEDGSAGLDGADPGHRTDLSGLVEYADYLSGPELETNDILRDRSSSNVVHGRTSGYGHGHRDHGHSGHGHSGHGGHGHDSFYVMKKECCELVVDPLAFLSLLAGIAGGTAFLNVAITMNIAKRRRRRRSSPASASGNSLNESLMILVKQGRRKWNITVIHFLLGKLPESSWEKMCAKNTSLTLFHSYFVKKNK